MLSRPTLTCYQCNEEAVYHSHKHVESFCSYPCFDQFLLNASSIGPKSDLPYTLPVSLRKFILKSTQYVASLSLPLNSIWCGATPLAQPPSTQCLSLVGV